ncbi:MAG: restriction endonuclease [Candidatus Geothermarchaeales archaeon]
MPDEIPAPPKEIEGYAKQGTTLEGRVAQLLRIQGYRVIRNDIVEGHEIDVHAESEDGKRILVECKEYYRKLVDREKVLIFATKVRDIEPDEAWFVTISDFEPPAHELCRRYGIRPINGFDLEELEEKAAQGPITLGPVPEEDRILRFLMRKRAQLRRKRRRGGQLKRVAQQISQMTRPEIALPPYLFPTEAEELEEKHIWLSDVRGIEKRHQKGTVHRVYLTPSPLRVRAFGITETREISLVWLVAAVSLVLTAVASNVEQYVAAVFLGLVFIASLVFHKQLRLRREDTYLYPPKQAVFVSKKVLYFPEVPPVNRLRPSANDILSNRAYGIPGLLVDGSRLGSVSDFLIDKSNWQIIAVKVSNEGAVPEETGNKESIIPVTESAVIGPPEHLELRINAVYVLGETFLKEEEL